MMKFILALVSFLIILFFGFSWINQSQNQEFFFLMDNTTKAQSWNTLVILAIAMLLGLACGSIFGQLKDQPGDKVKWKSIFLNFLYSKKTIMALLVSPIIYFSILKSIQSSGDGITNYLLSFHNGFFWEAVFASIIKEQSNGT